MAYSTSFRSQLKGLLKKPSLTNLAEVVSRYFLSPETYFILFQSLLATWCVCVCVCVCVTECAHMYNVYCLPY